MMYLCPVCDNKTKPKTEEYPGESGITATIQICLKCDFQYLPFREECKLNEKLLFRRNDEIRELKGQLSKALERLEQYERK